MQCLGNWKWFGNQLGQMVEVDGIWTFTISTVPSVLRTFNTISIIVSIWAYVVIRTENFRQLIRACIADVYYNGVFIYYYMVNRQYDQCQVRRLLFGIDIYHSAFRTDRECLNMKSMTILVFVIIAIVSGETELYQSQRWVTKILYDTLESYVPDGGPTCRRDGQAYSEGLKDLRLWATQSEFAAINSR